MDMINKISRNDDVPTSEWELLGERIIRALPDIYIAEHLHNLNIFTRTADTYVMIRNNQKWSDLADFRLRHDQEPRYPIKTLKEMLDQ